jgi:hypothetical protein
VPYPASITTLTTNKQDDIDAKSGTDLGLTSTTGDHAQHHNDIATELNAVETELGTLPKGPYAANVRERFELHSYKAQSCRFATSSALPAVTYANGTSGVGATLTANANGVRAAVDGITPVAADRMLVKNQAAALQNGIYTVTSIGAVGAPFVLTRAIDGDTSAKIADAKVLVDTGTANTDTEWYQSSTAPTMGTTALYWRRTQPIYGHGNPRSLWVPGSGPTVAQPGMETVPRPVATGQWTVPLAATTQWLIGGLVCPAGRTVSGLGWLSAVAGNAPTVSWFSLARVSDRLTMCHTANSTSASSTTTGNPRSFVTPWTPIEDTPVWLVMSYIHATTAMIVAATAGTAQSMAAPLLVAPVMFGTNAVTPTTTVPTDNTTVVTAATAGVATSATVGFPYFWLT